MSNTNNSLLNLLKKSGNRTTLRIVLPGILIGAGTFAFIQATGGDKTPISAGDNTSPLSVKFDNPDYAFGDITSMGEGTGIDGFNSSNVTSNNETGSLDIRNLSSQEIYSVLGTTTHSLRCDVDNGPGLIEYGINMDTEEWTYLIWPEDAVLDAYTITSGAENLQKFWYIQESFTDSAHQFIWQNYDNGFQGWIDSRIDRWESNGYTCNIYS